MQANYYTVEEVAERYKVSKRTVYTLVRQGAIRSKRIGGQIRIAHRDLETYEKKSAQ